MEHGEKEYRLLKSAYAFLNRQISLYEKTVERKVAEYNLLTRTVSRPGKQEWMNISPSPSMQSRWWGRSWSIVSAGMHKVDRRDITGKEAILWKLQLYMVRTIRGIRIWLRMNLRKRSAGRWRNFSCRVILMNHVSDAGRVLTRTWHIARIIRSSSLLWMRWMRRM